MNNNDVTSRDQAERHLSAVRVFEDALQAEYAKPEPTRNYPKIGGLQARIARGNKAAGVHAHLAVADEVAQLRAVLTANAATTSTRVREAHQ